MNFTEEQLSLIKEYIMNELTKERKILFDENMKIADFRNEVVHELSIISALQDSANNSLKEKIKSFENESGLSIEQKPSKQTITAKPSKNYWKYIVAALFLIAISFLLFWILNQQNSPNQVYAEMYETYPATEIKRGKIDEESLSINKAMDLYRQGDYQDALNEFEGLNLKDSSIEIYKGVCYMEIGQYSDAKNKFEELILSNDMETKQVAEWYNLLLLLKSNSDSDFNSALKEMINNESHLFNAKAKELKSKLD